MSASAILTVALQLLPLVQTGVQEFITWLETLRTAAKQTGEWSADQDAAYSAAIAAKKNDPAWQPDPPASAA